MTGNFKTFGDLSATASANTSIDSANVDENSPMAGLNNAIRALGAMGKGALTFAITSGTDTYTATLAPVPDALATNFTYFVGFASVNTSTAPTIALNGFPAKTIVLCDGVTPLVAGSLNGCHILEYDGTNMRLLNPALVGAPIADATNGGLNIAANKISLKPADLLTKTVPTIADSLMLMDAAATNAAKTATIAQILTGKPVQIVTTETGAVLTGLTVLPVDDTIPQSAEGDQFMSLAITPTNASSTLIIDAVWNGTNGGAGGTAVALFQDSTANALAVVFDGAANGAVMQAVPLRHKMTAGTTSATTFKIRAGNAAGSTTTFNGAGGSRQFGGVFASSMTITEYLP